MIEGIGNEIDSMLDTILEMQIVVKCRTKLIRISDTEMDYSDKFVLYKITRISNSLFSLELTVKTQMINFIIIQSYLEQQLLDRVLSKEQKSLEEQLTALLEDVTENAKNLRRFDKQLLLILANYQKSLFDGTVLMDVLNTIKTNLKRWTKYCQV